MDCRTGKAAVTKIMSELLIFQIIVQRRISEMSKDIQQQVIDEIKQFPNKMFSLQIDETTDVCNCAQLLAFARYVCDGDFKRVFILPLSVRLNNR